MSTAIALQASIADETKGAVALQRARFIDLVTYRANGEAVGTPVLFVASGDRLLVRTSGNTGKVKRLQANARVEVAASDSRGRHLALAMSGTARVLPDTETRALLKELHRKYPIAGRLGTVVRRMRREQDLVIEIRLDQPLADPRESHRRAVRAAAAAGLLVVAAASMVACGSGVEAAPPQPVNTPAPAPSAATTGTNPDQGQSGTGGGLCDYVDASIAAAALGEEVGPGKSSTSVLTGGRSCLYTASASKNWFKVEVKTDVERAEWDEQMNHLGMTRNPEVNGVGEAGYLESSSFAIRMAVFDSGRAMWFVVNKPGDRDVYGERATIAARALLPAVR